MIVKLFILVFTLLLVIIFLTNPHLINLVLEFSTQNNHKPISSFQTVKANFPKPLPLAPNYPLNIRPELEKQLEEHKTLALLIIKDNQLLVEKYYRIKQEDKVLSYSISKSILSMLIGIAIDNGMIQSLDQKVISFIPELNLSQDLKIKHLLTMSSGLKWNETFMNPFSDVVKAYYGNDLWKIISSTKSVFRPGQQFSYKCINTILLGIILERTSGMTVSDFTQKYLWDQIGAEFDAFWDTDNKGLTKTFCCFHATARDYAKLGLILLNKGFFNGKQIISNNYVNQMLTPAINVAKKHGDRKIRYGLHIWIKEYNGLTIPYMRGMFGQYIFIIPEKKSVIVRLGKKQLLPDLGQSPDNENLYIQTGLDIIGQA